jgi:predicted alpha/beta-fold hydrolase
LDVEPGTRVLAHCHWQADRAAHPALLALHGLEGSSLAHYMRGIADKAFARGFNVILLNQRNCGGTEELAEGLYHSGLTADADHVIREITARDGVDRIIVAGYSLGGNLLSENWGCASGNCAACAPSRPGLATCVDALERRRRRLSVEFRAGLRRDRAVDRARRFPVGARRGAACGC